MITLVGFGRAGNLHFQKYAELGLKVRAVVDPMPERLRPLESRVEDLVDSVEKIPGAFDDTDIVDVCTPHYYLLDIVQSLIDKGCKNLILEKPVALEYNTYKRIYRLLKTNHVACGVNETYYYSETLSHVCGILNEHGVLPRHVYLNFSKNRVPDVLAGRYIDSILGIEVPHQIAILRKILGKLHLRRVRVVLTDLNIETGGEVYTIDQMGTCKADMVSGNTAIALESSMCSKLIRTLAVDRGNCHIVADFPHGPQKTKLGRVVVSNKGKISHRHNIYDDMLRHSLSTITSCLYEGRLPPTDMKYISEAVKIIDQLNKKSAKGVNPAVYVHTPSA